MPVVFAFAFYIPTIKTNDIVLLVLQGKDDAVFQLVVMRSVVVARF
jgi:hypothetical protein